MLLEAVTVAVFQTEQRSINATPRLLNELSALGIARIAMLLVMLALFVRRYYAVLTPPSDSTAEERQGLLENGRGPVGYNGGANGLSTPKVPAGKTRDAQNAGWLDYLAGFRVLFPYLW